MFQEKYLNNNSNSNNNVAQSMQISSANNKLCY